MVALFKSFDVPSVFRFFRLTSSSASPSISEYERFVPCSSLFSSDDLSEPFPPSDLSSPELDDESLGVVLNSYTSSSSFDATFDADPLPDAIFDSSCSSIDFLASLAFFICCCLLIAASIHNERRKRREN